MVIAMGSQRDVLLTFAERDIRHAFSEFEGWNIAPIIGVQSPHGLYQASRNNVHHEDVAFISVSFDPVPRKSCISALESLPSSRGAHVKKYLLTPQASEVSALPPYVGILLMTAFAFVNGELVWLTKKKHSKQYHSEPVPVPAEHLLNPATSSQ
jgi:hypothetical protein